MRLFVAIDISSDVRTKLRELQRELKDALPGARWVALDNIHLTLRFLGEASEEKLPGLGNTLRGVCAGHEALHLEHRGLGCFPSARRPRVLWVGLGRVPGLLELYKAVEEAVRDEGFETETRPFRPHLTVARFRERSNAGPVVAEHRDRPFGETSTGEVVLYQSRPGTGGARYDALERFALSRAFGSRS